jgi:hypothetical protein
MPEKISASPSVPRREKELAYWRMVGRALRQGGYNWSAPIYRYPDTMRLLLPLRGTWLSGYRVAGDRIGVFFRAKGEARARVRRAAAGGSVSLKRLPVEVRLADRPDAMTYLSSIKLRALSGEAEEQLWLASTFTKFADLFVPLMTQMNEVDPILTSGQSSEDEDGVFRRRLTPAELEQAIRDALF